MIINWLNNNQGFSDAVLSGILVIVSIISIVISTKGTNQQNKIAIFEKGYEVYQEITMINTVVSGYFQLMDQVAEEQSMSAPDFYESLWYGMIFQDQDSSTTVSLFIKKQMNLIEQSKFLFSDLNEQELKQLEDYMKAYLAMSQAYLVVPHADSYTGIKPEEDYREYKSRFEECKIEEIIKKIEKQLTIR